MRVMRVREGDGLDRIKAEEMADPGNPGPGEIRVRLHANSLNYHDYAVCVGAIPSDGGRIPMADGAGAVDAVGEGVDRFSEGDSVVSHFFPDWADGRYDAFGFRRVPGDGIDGFAREAVITPAHWFSPAPRGWSHGEAATLPTAALTAWRCLFVEGGVQPGSRVLTMGTGGVSIFALQFAKAMGATVISTSSSADKLDRLTDLGADHVLNYKKDAGWGETVRSLTDGIGVDCVVEVGGPATLGQSIAAVRENGTISLVGVLTGLSGKVPTADFMRKQQVLKGITVGSHRMQREMIAAIDAWGLKPQIAKSFDLSELRAAFEFEESGAHFGKIVVTM